MSQRDLLIDWSLQFRWYKGCEAKTAAQLARKMISSFPGHVPEHICQKLTAIAEMVVECEAYLQLDGYEIGTDVEDSFAIEDVQKVSDSNVTPS